MRLGLTTPLLTRSSFKSHSSLMGAIVLSPAKSSSRGAPWNGLSWDSSVGDPITLWEQPETTRARSYSPQIHLRVHLVMSLEGALRGIVARTDCTVYLSFGCAGHMKVGSTSHASTIG